MSELIAQHAGVQQLAPAAEITPLQASTEVTTEGASVAGRVHTTEALGGQIYSPRVLDRITFRLQPDENRIKGFKKRKMGSSSSRWRSCAACSSGEGAGGKCDCRAGLIIGTYIMPYVSLGLPQIII